MPPKAHEADLILTNGKVITVDTMFSIAEAVAIKGDKIMAVGKAEGVEKLKGSETEVIDLRGKTLMPGLYDSHLHMIGTGAALQMINCRTPPRRSIADIAKVVGEAAKKSRPG